MKIYIAGKITGDPGYKHKFRVMQAELEAEGHTVLNPAVLPAGLTKAEYMRICFAMIDCADCVVFMPDWEQSWGAGLEMEYCGYIGKKYQHREWQDGFGVAPLEMTETEAIAYLQPIADSATLERYSIALNLALEALQDRAKKRRVSADVEVFSEALQPADPPPFPPPLRCCLQRQTLVPVPDLRASFLGGGKKK